MHEIEYIILPDHRRNMDTLLMLWPSFKMGNRSPCCFTDYTITNVYKIFFFLMIFCYLRQNIGDICCFEALNMFCKVIKEINANHNWCPFKNVKPIEAYFSY